MQEAMFENFRSKLSKPDSKAFAYVGVVDEVQGDKTVETIVGSAFVDLSDELVDCGPFTVLPKYQGFGVGRKVVHACIDHCKEQKFRTMQLVQVTQNTSSF